MITWLDSRIRREFRLPREAHETGVSYLTFPQPYDPPFRPYGQRSFYVFEADPLTARKVLSAFEEGAHLLYPDEFNDLFMVISDPYVRRDRLQNLLDDLIYEPGQCTEIPANHPSVAYNPPLSSGVWNITASGGVYFDAISAAAAGYDFVNDGPPSATLTFSGEAEVELELIKVPGGGGAIWYPDGNPLLLQGTTLDSLTGDLDDILDIPFGGFEILDTEIHEINYTTSGQHTLFVQFYPQGSQGYVPLGFGGGIERFTVCSQQSGAVDPMTLLRLQNCTIQAQYDGQNWLNVASIVRNDSGACNWYVDASDNFHGPGLLVQSSGRVFAADLVRASGANGFGQLRDDGLQWSASAALSPMTELRSFYVGSLPDSFDTRMVFQLDDHAGSYEAMRLSTIASEPAIGFFGAIGSRRQTLPDDVVFTPSGLLIANALQAFGLIDVGTFETAPAPDTRDYWYNWIWSCTYNNATKRITIQAQEPSEPSPTAIMDITDCIEAYLVDRAAGFPTGLCLSLVSGEFENEQEGLNSVSGYAPEFDGSKYVAQAGVLTFDPANATNFVSATDVTTIDVDIANVDSVSIRVELLVDVKYGTSSYERQQQTVTIPSGDNTTVSLSYSFANGADGYAIRAETEFDHGDFRITGVEVNNSCT